MPPHRPQLSGDIFNASPVGIAAETLDGQPLFVNAAFSSMLGFSEEEVAQQTACRFFSYRRFPEGLGTVFSSLRAGLITTNTSNGIFTGAVRWYGET
jgi:PAS domain S-box-containing protein